MDSNCQDCRAAAKHAYSDATTPGFFSDKCDKHRSPSPEEREPQPEQGAMPAAPTDAELIDLQLEKIKRLMQDCENLREHAVRVLRRETGKTWRECDELIAQPRAPLVSETPQGNKLK